MRRFKRFFAVLFVASTLLGALHEVIHDHVHDMEGHYEHSCPLYLLTQTPAVPNEPFILAAVDFSYEPFIALNDTVSSPRAITLRTRSPPLV
jgi:hypothetical protein